MRSSQSAAAACAALVVAALVGCGGTYDASVAGLVTLDGAPIPTGTVSFTPSSGVGSTAFGQIDKDGRYVLHTGREQGLPAGQYNVTVVATEPSAARGPGGGPPPLGRKITPDWYRDATTSGLNFTVAPGRNEINLELSTTPPAGWTPPRGGR